MSTPENETQRRFADLLSGPWREKAEHARAMVGPVSVIKVGESRVDLTTLQLVNGDKVRFTTLDAVFAPHWEREPGQEDMKIRDSFDYALGQMMLTELAVETGYVTLDVVRDVVRRELTMLLWSPGARRYLMTYDYVPVRFLAARVGIDLGLPAVDPPKPNEKAEVRFATFLSHHQRWSTDPTIDQWLGFLDDYVEVEGEQLMFAEFLRREGEAPRQRFTTLLVGVEHFLRSLANLFSLLDPDEVPHFGLVYAYWIARFYGMRLGKDGTYRQVDINWDAEVRGSPLFEDTDGHGLNDDLEVILRAWRRIQEFVKAHSGSSAPLPSSGPSAEANA
jgi:hypothetical protein